jgi:Ca2+-binding EF-hand superfamily protein
VSAPKVPEKGEALQIEAQLNLENVHSRSSRAAAQFIDVLQVYAQRTGGTINHRQFRQALQDLGVDLGNWENVAKVFASIDTDGSGLIEMSELRAAVGFIMAPDQDSAIERLMSIDKNRPSESILTLRSRLATQAARVLDLFRSWDENGDGLITKDEFRKVLHTLPSLHGTSNSAVDSLFASFDTDGSGAITFGELTRMFSNAPAEPNGSKKKGAPPAVVDLRQLKQEVTGQFLGMIMRQEMREHQSAALNKEFEEIRIETERLRQENEEESFRRRRQSSRPFSSDSNLSQPVSGGKEAARDFAAGYKQRAQGTDKEHKELTVQGGA